jgi:hypothetical protein
MLNLPRPYVRGLLETLWESAHETGDPVIGAVEDVEAAAEWTGEPGVLAEALIRLRFLDAVETDATDATDGDGHPSHPSQWELHDYFDHAPDYAKDRGQREQERRKAKKCDGCETDFRSSDPRAKYCSSACRKKAWRDRKSDGETDATDRDGSRRNGTESDGTPAPAPTPLNPNPERAGEGGGDAEAERGRDISEQSAAFERLEREYPPQGFVNVIAIQRTFYELWRSNPPVLPPVAEFFATLGAWKRSAKWLKDGGEYVPHCENWLSKGAWKRLPPDSQGSRKYPILPTVAEVQARFEAEHGSGGDS